MVIRPAAVYIQAMSTRVAVNGTILSPDEARISVFDRGFLYGDSVYEVLRAKGDRLLFLDAHLARLERSANQLFIPLPQRKQLIQELERTVSEAKNTMSYVRVIVTRGAGEIGLDAALASQGNRVIIVKPLSDPDTELYTRGARVALVRAALPQMPTVNTNDMSTFEVAVVGAKSGNYLTNVLAQSRARANGAHEALMVNLAGQVTEGSSSNVFAVIEGQLTTPPLSIGILEGITRRRVIDAGTQLGIDIAQQPITTSQLRKATELFITSTTRGVLPVTTLDTSQVGDGTPGPITRALAKALIAGESD